MRVNNEIISEAEFEILFQTKLFLCIDSCSDFVNALIRNTNISRGQCILQGNWLLYTIR
jgi:hypothetical protein